MNGTTIVATFAIRLRPPMMTKRDAQRDAKSGNRRCIRNGGIPEAEEFRGRNDRVYRGRDAVYLRNRSDAEKPGERSEYREEDREPLEVQAKTLLDAVLDVVERSAENFLPGLPSGI